MENERSLVAFEKHAIRRYYEEESETWYFSVVDVVGALTDSVSPRDYWFKMKIRVKTEDGFELSTICRQLKLPSADGKKYSTDCANAEGLLRIIHQEWSGVSVKHHKEIKGLKQQNLRDHMSEAELIFTALAELSTRKIAESVEATGMVENAEAGKKGGRIAKKARRELEQKTGRKVVTGMNFLPPSSKTPIIGNRK